MRPSLHVRPLSSGQVAALEAHYRRTSVPAERTRCQMILWSHQGLTPPAIAALIRVDPETVRRTIRRFNATGFGACKTARARGAVGERGETGDLRHRLAARLACRLAVKAGEPLVGRDLQELLELFRAAAPLPVCPHGRFIVRRLPDAWLERAFGRG